MRTPDLGLQTPNLKIHCTGTDRFTPDNKCAKRQGLSGFVSQKVLVGRIFIGPLLQTASANLMCERGPASQAIEHWKRSVTCLRCSWRRHSGAFPLTKGEPSGLPSSGHTSASTVQVIALLHKLRAVLHHEGIPDQPFKVGDPGPHRIGVVEIRRG